MANQVSNTVAQGFINGLFFAPDEDAFNREATAAHAYARACKGQTGTALVDYVDAVRRFHGYRAVRLVA